MGLHCKVAQVNIRGILHLGSQPIWTKTHLARYLDQQMGPCFAIGPLSVKLFDPFQSPVSYGPKFCNWGQGIPWPISLALTQSFGAKFAPRRPPCGM
jgi:hypothetical protein